MKRIVVLGLIAAAGVMFASAPAMAGRYYRGGVRVGVYGGYGPYYGPYRPYYYPPPRAYYYPPYAAYPAYPAYPAYGPPVVGGYYRGPGVSFSFGR